MASRVRTRASGTGSRKGLAYSSIQHIDSRDSLAFALNLRKPGAHEVDVKELSTTSVGSASAPGSAAPPIIAPPASSGKKAPLGIADMRPQAPGPPCTNRLCKLVDAWSWRLEAENKELRSRLEALVLSTEQDRSAADSMSTAPDLVSKLQKRASACLSQAEKAQEEAGTLRDSLAASREENRQLSDVVHSLKKEVLALKSKLYQARTELQAARGLQPKKTVALEGGGETRKTAWTHTGVYSMGKGGKSSRVWSCCLQDDEMAPGCTLVKTSKGNLRPSTAGAMRRPAELRSVSTSSLHAGRQRPRSAMSPTSRTDVWGKAKSGSGAASGRLRSPSSPSSKPGKRFWGAPGVSPVKR